MTETSDKNMKEYCCVLASGKLEELMKEFEAFRAFNEQYQTKGSVAFKQIDEIHSAISKMERLMENLNQLPSIAITNASIAANFENLCKKIGALEEGSLAAALGKKQVPMSVFLTVVLVGALAFLLKFLEDRNLDASPTSLHIHSRGQQAQPAEEPLPNLDSKKNPDNHE